MVIKRKLVAEKLLNKKDRKLSIQVNEMSQGVLTSENGSIMVTSDGIGMEEALQKLQQFVKSKVKYSDFNDTDKMHLVELFVTHSTTM